MPIISIKDACPGMVLDKDVYNAAGCVLLKCWTVLDQTHIQVLMSHDIAEVSVENPDSGWAHELGQIDARIEKRFEPYQDDELMRQLKDTVKDYLKNRVKPQ